MAKPVAADPALHEQAFLCLSCGYSLVGLSAPGRCPECGHKFDAVQLVLEGIPKTPPGSGSTLRVTAWWMLSVVLFFFGGPLFVVLFSIHWTVGLAVIGCMIAVFVWLLVTGPRDRSRIQRIIISPGGVACVPIRGPRQGRNDVLFMPWGGADGVELKRHSPVWKTLAIGRFVNGKCIAKLFESGIRCPDEAADMVTTLIEHYLEQARSMRETGDLGLPPAPRNTPPGPSEPV